MKPQSETNCAQSHRKLNFIGAIILAVTGIVITQTLPVGTTAQSNGDQEQSARNPKQDPEVEAWVKNRSDHEILIIDAIINKKKHAAVTDDEVLKFGFLNSEMVRRLHKQQRGAEEEQEEISAMSRFANSKPTPVDINSLSEHSETQRAALDAFLNAFTQTPPSSPDKQRKEDKESKTQ